MTHQFAVTGILLCLSLQLKTAHLSDICGINHDLHSDFKKGERRCCLTIQCSAGTEPVICSEDARTSCRPCPKHTFQPESTSSVDMKHCSPKTTCYHNQRPHHAKSRTKDTICKCDPKRGYCISSTTTARGRSGLPQCTQKRCEEGFRLTLNCSCEPCPPKELRTKACNASDSSFRTKRNSVTENDCSSTICLEDRGITTTTSPDSKDTVTESNETEVSNGSSYSSSIILIWCIVILIVVMVAAVCILAIKVCRRTPSSSSSSSEQKLRDSCNESSDNSQLEKEDLQEVKQSMIQQEEPRWNLDVLKTEADPLIKSGDISGSMKKDNSGESTIRIDGLRISEDTPVFPIPNDNFDSAKDDVSGEPMPITAAPRAMENIAVVPSPNDAAVSLSMSESDKRKLTRNRCLLVQDLVPDERFWSVLLSNGTVTSEMKEQIEKTGVTVSGINGNLIDYLQKRYSFSFETFLASLIITKHEHLARMLDRELTEKINYNFTSDKQLLKYVIGLRNL